MTQAILDLYTANYKDSQFLLGILTSYSYKYWDKPITSMFDTFEGVHQVAGGMQLYYNTADIYIAETDDDPEVFELYFFQYFPEEDREQELSYILDIETFSDITHEMLSELFDLAIDQGFVLF